MKLIIPVAGKGTRMRPFTHTRPKPLLPVAGKPMIDHIMDALLPLRPSGAVFVTGHLKDQFEEHMRARYGKALPLSFVEQERPRGTAQAIALAQEAFDEDVLIVFSDTIFDVDLSIIRKCEDDGIFWAMEVEDPRRFGVMVTDEDGYLARIVEKPREFVSNLANIGLYYIRNTKLLKEGLDVALERLARTDKEIYHVDAFTYMLAHGARIRVEKARGWYDCGTMEETLKTNEVLLSRSAPQYKAAKGVTIVPPVAIDPSARIEDSTIGPYVSIGEGVTVAGSTVSGSIIDAHSTVRGSRLKDSILGQHVELHGKDGAFFLGDHSRIG